MNAKLLVVAVVALLAGLVVAPLFCHPVALGQAKEAEVPVKKASWEFKVVSFRPITPIGEITTIKQLRSLTTLLRMAGSTWA
jgi:hypothetical protein